MSFKKLSIYALLIFFFTTAGTVVSLNFLAVPEQEKVCADYLTRGQEQANLMSLLRNAPAPDVFSVEDTAFPIGHFTDYQWYGGQNAGWGQGEWIKTEALIEGQYASIAFDDYDGDGCLDVLSLIDVNPGGNTFFTAGIALYRYNPDNKTLELSDYHSIDGEVESVAKNASKYFDLETQRGMSISVVYPHANESAMDGLSEAEVGNLPVEYVTRGVYSYSDGKIVLQKVEEEAIPDVLAEVVNEKK